MNKRLDDLKGRWTKELDNTGETPFRLVYGSEVVTPTEIVVDSHRVNNFEATFNDEHRCIELDLVEVKMRVSYKLERNMRLAIARHYNRRVSCYQFYVGEMIWRRNKFAHLV